MARVQAPPPKLTKKLTADIEAKIAEINAGIAEADCTTDAATAAPANSLGWIARSAGVTRTTVIRWCKRAYIVRNSGMTGSIADQWIRYADAVDALHGISTDAVELAIKEIAGNVAEKKRLDAYMFLARRNDTTEGILAAADIEPEGDLSVAHIPQSHFDALTDEETAQLNDARATLGAAIALRDRLLNLAADRVNDAVEED